MMADPTAVSFAHAVESRGIDGVGSPCAGDSLPSASGCATSDSPVVFGVRSSAN